MLRSQNTYMCRHRIESVPVLMYISAADGSTSIPDSSMLAGNLDAEAFKKDVNFSFLC